MHRIRPRMSSHPSVLWDLGLSSSSHPCMAVSAVILIPEQVYGPVQSISSPRKVLSIDIAPLFQQLGYIRIVRLFQSIRLCRQGLHAFVPIPV